MSRIHPSEEPSITSNDFDANCHRPCMKGDVPNDVEQTEQKATIRQETDKVLVIGGFGFIGYHLMRALKRAGYYALASSRSKSLFDQQLGDALFIDLKSMTDEHLRSILREFSVVIFAGGVDDRSIPSGDASSFFYDGNVAPCVRLAVLCRELPVKKIVILGSYFSHFCRTRPEWKMADRHPYVKSRKLQHEETVAASLGDTEIVTLDLPYIFGSTPGKIPLWKPLVKYIRSSPIILYTNGGTNIVSVEQVAQATIGAMEMASHNESWTVGDANVSWKEMIALIANAMGMKRRIVALPNIIVRVFALLAGFYFRLTCKQSGLNPYYFISTQTANTFLNTEPSMEKLKYTHADMQKSIEATVRACGY
jgi:dihydroflavonol-4-reductase